MLVFGALFTDNSSYREGPKTPNLSRLMLLKLITRIRTDVLLIAQIFRN